MPDIVLDRGTDYVRAYATLAFTEAGQTKLGLGDAVGLPVGVVLLTEENTNPATLGLPGTWEEY